MKTRQGFVCNSSSSSFIVAFPHKPVDQTELQTFLFSEETEYPAPWDYCETKSWPATKVSKAVWSQIKDEQALTREEAFELLDGGFIEEEAKEEPNLDKFEEDGKTDWDAFWKARKEYAAKIYDSFVAANPNTEIFGFTFSDNRGEFESALEHGDLFHRLKHIVIGQH